MERSALGLQKGGNRRRSAKNQVSENINIIVDCCVLDLGITADNLLAPYSIATRMNPMFGRKPNIIGSGLMTERQYNNGRDSLLGLMQDVYDDLTPVFEVADSDSDDSNSKDGSVRQVSNSNHQKAKDELDAFDLFKRQKYIPTIKFSRSLSGTDDRGKQFVVGMGSVVEDRGKDLPSDNF